MIIGLRACKTNAEASAITNSAVRPKAARVKLVKLDTRSADNQDVDIVLSFECGVRHLRC